MVEVLSAFLGVLLVGLAFLFAVAHDGTISKWEIQFSGWAFAAGFALFIIALLMGKGHG